MNNINASIIDQRVRQLAQDLAPEIKTRLNLRDDEARLRSIAFVFLVVKTVLDLPEDETLDCLTDGGNDFGVDAIHVGDVQDGEFAVTLFQGKYKDTLEGKNAFPENGVTKVIQTVTYLFDPDAAISLNDQLAKAVSDNK
ncbi:MAG TPA: hypothetical protein PKH24_20215 [Sedimentisphaerales bacterium]|jgi:hypothetical protein|nr:hypothetical protein [Sedimentisphaerales bacterium]HNU31447.1 hypothetical protein [Sedimentisphaerales bacterium]